MAGDPTHDDVDPDARDRVLELFMNECPLPMPEDVERWGRRHPEYAAEILDCAEMLAHAALANVSRDPPALDPRDEAAVAHAVRLAMGDRHPDRSETLADRVRASGRSIQDLAAKVGLHPDVLAGMASGAVALPRRDDLLDALAPELLSSVAELRRAGEATRARPTIGAASAGGAPRVAPVSFSEAVAASPMSDALKARWLRGE